MYFCSVKNKAKMNRVIVVFLILFAWISLPAQPPTGYYDAADNKSGEALRLALHNIINNHTSLSYKELWEAFYTTDMLPNNSNQIWDMYSSCSFIWDNDKCGNYQNECDCYNREHSMPKSWFNDQYPMYTDLFHIYPTDGKVNNMRSNYPFGEVGNATYVSANGGSKLGSARSELGYSGTVFEPIDEYKGDFARTYFYMSTCYRNKRLDYENGSTMFNGARLKNWAVRMLITWSNEDPVSEKEINRNNAVYALQQNRNPFIDHPELAGLIWGADSVNKFHPNGGGDSSTIVNVTLPVATLYPNPATTHLNVVMPIHSNANIIIYNMMGKAVLHDKMSGSSKIIDLSELLSGVYFLKIEEQNRAKTYKIIVIN
jgi:endonuclease I